MTMLINGILLSSDYTLTGTEEHSKKRCVVLSSLILVCYLKYFVCTILFLWIGANILYLQTLAMYTIHVNLEILTISAYKSKFYTRKMQMYTAECCLSITTLQRTSDSAHWCIA